MLADVQFWQSFWPNWWANFAANLAGRDLACDGSSTSNSFQRSRPILNERQIATTNGTTSVSVDDSICL